MSCQLILLHLKKDKIIESSPPSAQWKVLEGDSRGVSNEALARGRGGRFMLCAKLSKQGVSFI